MIDARSYRGDALLLSQVLSWASVSHPLSLSPIIFMEHAYTW